MKRLSVDEFNARMAQLREAFNAPPMSRDELARFYRESRRRDDALWDRIRSDDRPQQRLALS